MTILTDSPNKIIYDKYYDRTLYGVVNDFLFNYGDEFAARRFLRRHREAREKLKFVNEYSGRSSDIYLARNDLRRILIRGYHYVIIYQYRRPTVKAIGVFYSGLDFQALFESPPYLVSPNS